MLATLRDVQLAARQGNYIAAAPHAAGLDIARALIALAERRQAPLIVQLTPDASLDLRTRRRLIEAVRAEAAAVHVPVVIHCAGAGSLQAVQTAVDLGCASVTLDISGLPYDESTVLAAEASAIAHAAGAQLEVLLAAEQWTPDHLHEFVVKTGIDALLFNGYSQARTLISESGILHGGLDMPCGLVQAPANVPLPDLLAAGICRVDISHEIDAAVEESLAMALASGRLGINMLVMLQVNAACHAVDTALTRLGSAHRTPPRVIDIPAYAERLYRDGYSCTEAVFRAFAEAEGYPSDVLQRAASLFLGGMCNQGLTCGTLIGGLMVIGAREAHVHPAYKRPRRAARALGVELIRWYITEKGSTACAQLLNLDLADPEQGARYYPEGYFDRVCVPLVRATCEWLVERFASEDTKRSAGLQARSPDGA